MNGYHRWRRFHNRKLSDHFNTREFVCRCGICGEQRISEELINKLELVRVEYGMPITITSAFRCGKYQAQLRGSLPPGHTAKGPSTHEYGNAVDVRGPDMAVLLNVLNKHFMCIGVSNTFFHVDTRADKVRRWKYE